MTEFRRPYPAFNIPLTDQEKQLLGEIVAIQGQIEFLLGAIVHDALGLDRNAMHAIMHSASLKVNAHIFITVIRAKITNQVTLASAENIFARMEALSKGRNDFIHALYAYDEAGAEFSLVSGLEMRPIENTVAVKTGSDSKRTTRDLLAVRDEAASISQELSLVRLYLRNPVGEGVGPPIASRDKRG
jgi:hypothetical protein